MKVLYMIQFFILAAVVAQAIFNTTWRRNHEESIVRQNISFALNAASDAATEFMLWDSDITPFGNIILDPNVVWDIYIHTFLESIGLNSEQNRKDIQSFFPLAIIVVNDGYFMRLATVAERQQQTVIRIPNLPISDQMPLYDTLAITSPIGEPFRSEQWVYKFTQKIPFARVTTEPTPVYGHDDIFDDHVIVGGFIPPGIVVADTLSGGNIITFNPNAPMGNRFSRSFIDGTRATPLRGGAHFPPYIARELLRAMDYSMTWNAPMTSLFRTAGGFSIPAEMSEFFTAENVTFIGPMVIAILDGFDWIGTSEMSFWSLSNTQIVDSPQVFVYHRGLEMVYSLCDPRLPNGGRPHMMGQGLELNWGLFPLLQIFSTQEAAAAAGARPDLRVLQWCF